DTACTARLVWRLLPRHRPAGIRAESATGSKARGHRDPLGAAAGACHRSDLSARDRAHFALLHSGAAATVRRLDLVRRNWSYYRYSCARRHGRARDLPIRPLRPDWIKRQNTSAFGYSLFPIGGGKGPQLLARALTNLASALSRAVRQLGGDGENQGQ